MASSGASSPPVPPSAAPHPPIPPTTNPSTPLVTPTTGVSRPLAIHHPTSMAQTPPEGTSAPIQAPGRVPRPIPEVPAGYVFHPNGRDLLEVYLIPRALGVATKGPYYEGVADGVDFYAVRPEALPFSRRSGVHGHVWAYFYATRPAGGALGSEGSSDEDNDDDDVRDVAAGGCWRRYGGDKEYVGRDDGEVYGFRQRFTFHVAAGPRGKIKKTVWRMKEFRLKETAARFHGVVSQPDAMGHVIWKVYNQVIPEEEPAVDYYDNGINDQEEEEEEIGPVVITVGDAAAAPSSGHNVGVHQAVATSPGE